MATIGREMSRAVMVWQSAWQCHAQSLMWLRHPLESLRLSQSGGDGVPSGAGRGEVPSTPPSYTLAQRVGLVLGPLLFVLISTLFEPEGLSEQAIAVAACSLWIACWWITEAVPIPVTSLLPIVLFPLTGAMEAQVTASAYGDRIIFLFLGGFILALALERWGLHKRIALALIQAVGTGMSQLVLGFMLATAFLSMWISNTATAMMMVPVGTAIIYQVTTELGEGNPLRDAFAKALLLGIAYSASIGGLATLIGTPPNAIAAGVIREFYGIEIGFGQWMLFALPLSLLFLMIAWFYLVRVRFDLMGHSLPGSRTLLQKEQQRLGAMGREEKLVMIIFLLTAFFWISRGFLLSSVTGLNDTSIALCAAFLLFCCPARDGQRLIGWNQACKLPWGILLLFGGGLAIAAGFSQTGLAQWVGSRLVLLSGVDLWVMVLMVCISVTFLSELTSNTATATMMFPVMAGLALALDIHPFALMLAAGLASSCAFMMPVATPPNAVVFSASELKIVDMTRVGVWLNLTGGLLVSLLIYFWLPLVWELDLSQFPEQLRNALP